MLEAKAKFWLGIILTASHGWLCRGDAGIVAPSGGTGETNTVYPFLIKQAGLNSIRYQQVYNSSLFAKLDGNRYLRSLWFYGSGWTVSNMQINLSTTSKTADGLSPLFSENVGSDDQVVLGPGTYRIPSNSLDGYQYLFFDHPFPYNPALGNLLLDVRIFDGTGPYDTALPSLDAFDSPTDEVSRVWSSSVAASVADEVDAIGLKTELAFGTDFFLTVPAPRTNETSTIFPFLIQQTYPSYYPSNVLVSTHYQQVYSYALFTKLDPSLIYITALTFFLQSAYTNHGFGWTVTNLQISLSTTTNGPGGLSPVFSENVGADRVVGFSGTNIFSGSTPDGPLTVYLERPLRYNPARGNLLLEVQLSTKAGPDGTDVFNPWLEAFGSPTGEVSRIWSTNMTSTVADEVDGTGLATIFRLSPTPSLKAQFFPVAYDGETNIIEISWPSQPSIFQLQQADHLGSNMIWRSVTNQILGIVEGGNRFIWVPVTSAAAQAYYRLIWAGGN